MSLKVSVLLISPDLFGSEPSAGQKVRGIRLPLHTKKWLIYRTHQSGRKKKVKEEFGRKKKEKGVTFGSTICLMCLEVKISAAGVR